ncbi:forkhead box protein P2 [Austrofundulus limnaeus]|uniref:Forkhead box protein P2 n=1 Tax=Austrofundulus limnaeus TaxID=52670 RepID=A0A2I4B6W8_AUSLI|nr:PREDICTED: forkhead box protein P2 [Austrofundulus limnaeus]
MSASLRDTNSALKSETLTNSEMPESPLSPTAARQTPTSSLLTHADTAAGGRATDGDCSREMSVENRQSLLHKQVFLAMMSPQQQLLSPNQLQVLIQHKQQALLLQQLPAQQFQQLFQSQKPSLSAPSLSAAGLSPAEMQQIWKELREDKTILKSNQDSCAQKIFSERVKGTQINKQLSERSATEDPAATHLLFAHSVCNWPGCESVCENLCHFIKHLGSEHSLDDRSTAQCRVQMQVVQQLELQLSKERKRLQAMMAHLYLPSSNALSPTCDLTADPHSPQWQLGLLTSTLPSLRPLDSVQAIPQSVDIVSSPTHRCEEESPTSISKTAVMRCRDQPLVFSMSSENEYELYKNTDIRPPFTYATLIRQAIMEASDMQLTLNEIYNWFTKTFAYFRRNAATWKNAVRHNLSLHKCFVRVENVKGAVWTVDEEEYQRRRSQRIAGSPSLMKTVSSSLALGATLQSTLQAALAEASLSGFKQESVSRKFRSRLHGIKPTDVNSHRKQNSSPQVQQQLHPDNEELKINEQECLLATVKPVSLQRDMSGKNEEHLFDLE